MPPLLVLHLQCVCHFTLFTTLQSLIDLITVKQNCTFISLTFFKGLVTPLVSRATSRHWLYFPQNSQRVTKIAIPTTDHGFVGPSDDGACNKTAMKTAMKTAEHSPTPLSHIIFLLLFVVDRRARNQSIDCA